METDSYDDKENILESRINEFIHNFKDNNHKYLKSSLVKILIKDLNEIFLQDKDNIMNFC